MAEDLPGPQTTPQGTPLVFSEDDGNALGVDDPAVGDQAVQLTLSVSDGTLSLGDDTGLTFQSGGEGQSWMTFSGDLNDVNAALDGRTFTPWSYATGGLTLYLDCSDLDHTGWPLQTSHGSVAITIGRPRPSASPPPTPAPPRRRRGRPTPACSPSASAPRRPRR